MTKKKKNAKTQHKKGEPITDRNRLTTDITKALRYPADTDHAYRAAVLLNKFGVIRSQISCTEIGEWCYLTVVFPVNETLFIADPAE